MFLLLGVVFSVIVYSSQETVKVTVFYESLCPASKTFISKQLYPAYQRIGGDYIDLELLPYSVIERSKRGRWKMSCQHGDRECFANRIQACALKLYEDNASAIGFVACAMASDKPSLKSNNIRCAKNRNLSWPSILNCAESKEIFAYLQDIYNRGASLTPELRYLPHIYFNNGYNKTIETSAHQNFFETVCKFLDKAEVPMCESEVLADYK